MSWLETTGGRQFAAVRGECNECERLWLARDVAQLDSDTVHLAVAQRRLTTHMQDVLHMDPPPSYRYVADRPWALPDGFTTLPPLPSSVIAGTP